jgi:glycosyltransferase involved in cell wall biosynthesis
MSERPPARVAVVQSWLTPYRLPFYEHLRRELAARSVELSVVYGQADRAEASKRPHTVLPWGRYAPNRYMGVAGREVSWQPCLGLTAGADLVVVEQALKRLVNPVLLARRRLSGPRVAFWGHGRAFQGHRASPVAEGAKRRLSRGVDWWFAYNELSARVVEALPYPRSRITVVNNSVDTTGLQAARERLVPAEVAALRSRLDVRSSNVALFVGGMYPDKRLGFLLESCRRVRAVVPDFEVVLVGDGPDVAEVEAAARRHRWVHLEPPRFGAELAPYFAAARLLLVPGVVGLAVLDSFAFGVPLVTCDLAYHSPEIDYVVPGVNAAVVGDAEDAGAYAGAVVDLLGDGPARRRLEDGCRRSASSYTVESMAQRFAAGVQQALDAA